MAEKGTQKNKTLLQYEIEISSIAHHALEMPSLIPPNIDNQTKWCRHSRQKWRKSKTTQFSTLYFSFDSYARDKSHYLKVGTNSWLLVHLLLEGNLNKKRLFKQLHDMGQVGEHFVIQCGLREG